MIETIVAFDLGAQTSSEIPLPDSVYCHGSRFPYLGILAGKLSVLLCVENGECEVWVMVEYGVANSWVKHHVFSQFSGDITPYGFTSCSEFLFRSDDRRFALYDPVSAKNIKPSILS
ncbi:unnamed protein product [Lactuca virosa]|uniref:F-box associated domain-containing protein n=1 Tax=Lactuca virosa TaxID=75947 RepID=A0AAU9MZ94_9ASTR|nr:unnamed protein product [Lactuca virosa]